MHGDILPSFLCSIFCVHISEGFKHWNNFSHSKKWLKGHSTRYLTVGSADANFTQQKQNRFFFFFLAISFSSFTFQLTYWPLLCWIPSMFLNLRNIIMLLAGTKCFCCVLSIAIYSQWDFNGSLSQLDYSNKCIKTSNTYVLLICDWGHWGIQIHGKSN